MGIFNKDSKAEAKRAPGEKKKLHIVEGDIPPDLDVNDQDALKGFIAKVLKNAGLLPQDAEISAMKLESVGSSSNKTKGLSLAAILKELNLLRGTPIPDLSVPQDAGKAAFVNAYNILHHRAHELAPLMVDLLQAVEVISLSMKLPGISGKERGQFRNFENCVLQIAENMMEFGQGVCELGSRVSEGGIPAPDSSRQTIN